LTSLSGAGDLDAIRAALGEARLTLHTASYGTIMGQRYAEEYPGRLRALVLDSVEDHSQDTRSYLDVHAAAVQDSFDEFVAWCGRDPACALRGQNVRAVWADLLARADRGQLTVPDDPGQLLRSTDVITIAKNALAGPDWAGLAATLQALRSGSPPAPGFAPAATGSDPGAAGSDPVAFPAGVVCSDWNLRVRDYQELAAHLRRTATIAPDLRWSPSTTVTSCLGYPTAIPNPQHALHVPGGRPILLLNALHDPATSYLGATNVAHQLGRRAALLTYLGWGHGVHGRTPCADAALDRYLISLIPPQPATTCPAIPPPSARVGSSFGD
jgi:pimeloyl-ACP methyl ester carboxylesterase